jgi:hypothetical protein
VACLPVPRAFSEIVLDGQLQMSSSVGMYRGACIPDSAVGRRSHSILRLMRLRA